MPSMKPAFRKVQSTAAGDGAFPTRGHPGGWLDAFDAIGRWSRAEAVQERTRQAVARQIAEALAAAERSR